MKLRWKRICAGHQILFDGTRELGAVRILEDCRFWFPYLGDSDYPDGIRFDRMWEAKRYVEGQVAGQK